MIEVKNLTKSFGNHTILKNISFTVNDGDSVVIIGGSGCGKSTLLRCLNHLVVPEEGEILFNGKNILDKKADIDAYRTRIGMVYQHFNLFEHLNVMENMILAPMKVLHLSKEEAVSRAETLLDKVGMLNRKYRDPAALSGGQKQRVAIARTLMMQPDMILFDEPTSALDPTMVDEVERVIKNLIQNGMTSVIVTHEMRFAEKISNRTIFLAEKGIYEEGPSEQLFTAPKRELTRQFIYRSRLFTKEVDIAGIDYRSLVSELRNFASSYGCTADQEQGIKSCIDEILMPLLTAKYNGIVQFNCSETGAGHKLIFEFPSLKENPLETSLLDAVGLQLLGQYTQSISSDINADKNREITVVLK